MNIDELRELTSRLAEEPEYINELSDEQALEIHRYLNPVGNVVSSDRQYANMSIYNWSEEYMKKFFMTAMTSFIYRLQSEYTPDDEIKYLEDKLDKECQNKSTAEVEKLRREHAAYVKKLTTNTRGVIKKFLDRNFEFSGDNHLRAATSKNEDDPERSLNNIKTACETASASTSVEAAMVGKKDRFYTYLRDHTLATYQNTVDAASTLKQSINVLSDSTLNIADKQGILLRKYKDLSNTIADMGKIAKPLAAADTLSAWQVTPPIDVFHQYNRYVTNHYEQLREVVQALYNEKPDIEHSIVFYKAFDSAEEAATHRNQHESDFSAEVFTIENSGITMLGPFKENRGRVAYYNKNVELMKRMTEQIEADHKLGKDLMEKKVKKAKKRNIEREGPDDPGLVGYSKAMNTIQDLGAKKILSREDKDKLAEAQKVREDAEVPDDAIQVDMFHPVVNEDGETELSRTLFYSQAEAPLHLQEGSDYSGKYQEPRKDNLKESYKTKTIVSSTGEKKEIKVRVAQRDD